MLKIEKNQRLNFLIFAGFLKRMLLPLIMMTEKIKKM